MGLALCLGTLTESKYIFVYASQRGTAMSVGCVYWLGRQQRWCHVGVVMDGWIDGWGFYILSMLLRCVCVCVCVCVCAGIAGKERGGVSLSLSRRGSLDLLDG